MLTTHEKLEKLALTLPPTGQIAVPARMGLKFMNAPLMAGIGVGVPAAVFGAHRALKSLRDYRQANDPAELAKDRQLVDLQKQYEMALSGNQKFSAIDERIAVGAAEFDGTTKEAAPRIPLNPRMLVGPALAAGTATAGLVYNQLRHTAGAKRQERNANDAINQYRMLTPPRIRTMLASTPEQYDQIQALNYPGATLTVVPIMARGVQHPALGKDRTAVGGQLGGAGSIGERSAAVLPDELQAKAAAISGIDHATAYLVKASRDAGDTRAEEIAWAARSNALANMVGLSGVTKLAQVGEPFAKAAQVKQADVLGRYGVMGLQGDGPHQAQLKAFLAGTAPLPPEWTAKDLQTVAASPLIKTMSASIPGGPEALAKLQPLAQGLDVSKPLPADFGSKVQSALGHAGKPAGGLGTGAAGTNIPHIPGAITPATSLAPVTPAAHATTPETAPAGSGFDNLAAQFIGKDGKTDIMGGISNMFHGAESWQMPAAIGVAALGMATGHEALGAIAGLLTMFGPQLFAAWKNNQGATPVTTHDVNTALSKSPEVNNAQPGVAEARARIAAGTGDKVDQTAVAQADALGAAAQQRADNAKLYAQADPSTPLGSKAVVQLPKDYTTEAQRTAATDNLVRAGATGDQIRGSAPVSEQDASTRAQAADAAAGRPIGTYLEDGTPYPQQTREQADAQSAAQDARSIEQEAAAKPTPPPQADQSANPPQAVATQTWSQPTGTPGNTGYAPQAWTSEVASATTQPNASAAAAAPPVDTTSVTPAGRVSHASVEDPFVNISLALGRHA